MTSRARKWGEKCVIAGSGESQHEPAAAPTVMNSESAALAPSLPQPFWTGWDGTPWPQSRDVSLIPLFLSCAANEWAQLAGTAPVLRAKVHSWECKGIFFPNQQFRICKDLYGMLTMKISHSESSWVLGKFPLPHHPYQGARGCRRVLGVTWGAIVVFQFITSA